MEPVELFLLTIAAIFSLGAIGELVFQRTSVPDVVWLIAAGIALGPIGGVVTREQLSVISPYFAALTLVVVLFEGGTALKLEELVRAAPRSSVLAVLGFGLSTAAIALLTTAAASVGLLPEGWTWTHSLMTGAILGGSSSIIIMPAMAQAKVSPRLASLLGIESSLTDALCVVVTGGCIQALTAGDLATSPVVALGKSFTVGFMIGGMFGLAGLLALRFLRSSDHAFPVTLAALLVLYVIVDGAGGSAALAILTAAVLLGNARGLSRRLGFAEPVELDTSLRGFHRQLTFIVKSFFFVFIGAMLGPPFSLLALGVILGATLFVVRVPAVLAATFRSGFDRSETRIAMAALPRGMAAGVLATLPAASGVIATEGLPVVVFAAVLTTIISFAVAFPLARRLGAPAAEVAAAEASPDSNVVA